MRAKEGLVWIPLWGALGLAMQGCPLLIAGTVAGGALGVQYTVTNVAYKVFSHPLPRVEEATRAALRRMQIEHVSPLRTESGSEIRARTAELDITITFERITPQTTKMSVDAVQRRYKVIKDKALAAEVIAQTGRGLGEG